MPIRTLRDFLDKHRIRYFIISHSPAYTAQEIAAAAHVPGRELAKTVMVTIDGKLAMAVLPASRQLDFTKLREAAGTEDVLLASEQDFADMFPGCEVGAMPPFGNLYGMDTYVDEALAQDEEIVFNAGAHTELLRLTYQDYERLVEPVVVALSVR
ncbi:YbaK/EbsC family protein [Prosthecochloris sp. N3]|uniref:YbaK/EbsC family protein n=1 Tax=Prosthecochloris ethylica TaxID=2743976 RepID=A0ABR9XNR2_9CHLB|nr:YbaK/EbsC family protein [Prosthecochloris ethylica]MBF0585733.1 YbaK/EbsC family protein [Prosthecochloris ethylica]MBF0635643.1 YbaK/EbsC family protein [Prosthecochloris ethylica]MEC9486565.1 YbaK/EbsC family protein [Prosthecochloris sp.]NUK46942.1 YbaK/EbsC family protein [Prosthecochloris ethylica]